MMVYAVATQSLNRKYGFVELELIRGDGDLKKVELQDPNQDDGKYMHHEHGRHWDSGRALKVNYIPKQLRRRSGRNIPDFNKFNGLFVVSDKFKSIVERLEPGVHQFIPLQIVEKGGEVLTDMWFMVVCNRLDTVDRERTTMVLHLGRCWTQSRDVPEDYWPEGFVSRGRDEKIVFNRSQIGDHHLWRDKHEATMTLVSDALAEALQNEGVTGINFFELESV
ncbi:MAG: hypothetical protein CVT85_12605 [Alphaproteobacteria bacterium HGW-Alphaproteobacteria-7]|jgi:hypothetical protein|nr:MAG: hypothetical protein CVT85_12605 [Alphaproteobacteria bacterium HGW-Alphaproteobacteria-7]